MLTDFERKTSEADKAQMIRAHSRNGKIYGKETRDMNDTISSVSNFTCTSVFHRKNLK